MTIFILMRRGVWLTFKVTHIVQWNFYAAYFLSWAGMVLGDGQVVRLQVRRFSVSPPAVEIFLPYFSGAPSSRLFAPWRDFLCTLTPGGHRFAKISHCLDPVLASGGGSGAKCMEVRPHSVRQSSGGQLDAGGGIGHRQKFLDDTWHALGTCCSHRQAF